MARLTFADVGESRDNNFDFLRFVMASLVVFAHSYAINNGACYMGADPLARLTKWQEAYGGLAVKCFFLISGYLITKSWMYSRSTRDYARKRVLRIAPALCASLLFCVFIVGPLATQSLGAYLRDSHTYRFLGIMFVPRIEVADRLPGVFVSNPLPEEVNGPLWTIRYEVICYVMVAVLGLVGVFRKRSIVLGIAFVMLVLHVLGDEGGRVIHLGLAHNLVMLFMFFLTGTVYYLYREKIPFSAGLFTASVVAMILAAAVGLLPWVSPVLIPYALFYIAFCKGLRLQHFARYGDLSYGIYVYGFPIQQLVTAYFPASFSAPTHFAVSMAIILACAAVSWNYLEHPFLRLKSRPIMEDRELDIALVSSVPTGAPVEV